jgi:hypothetical protein
MTEPQIDRGRSERPAVRTARESPGGMTAGVFALGLALVAACSSQPAAPPPTTDTAPPAGALTEVTDNGPVKVTVQVWPQEPRLGDPIHLRLTAESGAGVSIDLPYQEAAVGRFAVSTYDRSETRVGDKRIQIQDYVLDAPSSGRHRIPPFRLEMVDPAVATGPTEVLTEEIPLQIGEVDVQQTTATLPPPRTALPAEVGGTPWWVWVAAALGAAWVVIGVLVLVRVRRDRAVRIKMTASDVALDRLAALELRGAPAGDDTDAWFVELSSIVRRYLEARYDIRAPELTTEEFLGVAARSAELTAGHKELLSSFMARCDRVKFAAYRPEAEESLATLRAARGFVEDTRLRADADAAPAAAPAKGAA